MKNGKSKILLQFEVIEDLSKTERKEVPMTRILTGTFAGFLTFLCVVILILHSNENMKQLIIGHYLISDIFFTVISFLFLPVVGSATLINTGIFCICISIFLTGIRKHTPYKRIVFSKIGMIIPS